MKSYGTPKVSVRIPTREKKELARMADQVGLDLASAMRQGARYYLNALAHNSMEARKAA